MACLILHNAKANECDDHLKNLITDKAKFTWCTDHEKAKFSQYTWLHKNTACGKFDITRDPTTSNRNNVYWGEISCSDSDSLQDSHRLYPTLNLKECSFGPYNSSFLVWIDLADIKDFEWISIATYSNKKNWQDLFGLNLIPKNDGVKLIIFHVPTFGIGKFEKVSNLYFPLRKWVKIDINVGNSEIKIYQDGELIIKAKKQWGVNGPSICEAHWGLYADRNTKNVVILNDDIYLYSNEKH